MLWMMMMLWLQARHWLKSAVGVLHTTHNDYITDRAKRHTNGRDSVKDPRTKQQRWHGFKGTRVVGLGVAQLTRLGSSWRMNAFSAKSIQLFYGSTVYVH